MVQISAGEREEEAKKPRRYKPSAETRPTALAAATYAVRLNFILKRVIRTEQLILKDQAMEVERIDPGADPRSSFELHILAQLLRSGIHREDNLLVAKSPLPRT